MKWIILPLVSAVMWRIGGWKIKSIRRYLMPISLALYGYFKGKKGKKAFLIILSAIGLSMGYGEKHSWGDRVLFCFLVVLPTFFLGWSIWQIIFPVVFLGGFYLSNEHGTAELWKWHYLEVLFGIVYGCLIASVI